jgi:hypothetical protein
MVRLTGKGGEEALRGRVPDLALRRARELRDKGVTVLVLEETDDVVNDFGMIGRFGLVTYLDDHYQAPFGYVKYAMEVGQKIYEALLLPSGRFLLVAPDAEWVDSRLLVVLDVESDDSPC